MNDIGSEIRLYDVSGKIIVNDVSSHITGNLINIVTNSATYVHNQNSAQTTWEITHNLNSHPSVTVVDSAGTVVYGEISYNSDIKITLTFSAPFSGKAYLN